MSETTSPRRCGPVAVTVHGPATNPLTTILWQLGYRPLPGTTTATVWLPRRRADQEGVGR